LNKSFFISRRRFLSWAAVSGWAGISARRSFAQEPEPGWITQAIPYVHQPGGGYCYQAGLAMVLRYFFPGEKTAFRELDRLTHHRPGSWTFEAQLLPALLDRGLRVELHATTPYAELTPGLAEKRYGKEAAARLDFRALAWAREFLQPGVFFQHGLEWKDAAENFRAGGTIFFCVNEDVLVGQNLGKFIGHGLVLTGLSTDQARVHDPARYENMPYPQTRLAAAFTSPGTDRACILIRRG